MKRLLLASSIFFTSPTFCQTKRGKVDNEPRVKLQLASQTVNNLITTAKQQRAAAVLTTNNSVNVAPKGRRNLNLSANGKMKIAIAGTKH
jgi:hypothetical protein